MLLPVVLSRVVIDGVLLPSADRAAPDFGMLALHAGIARATGLTVLIVEQNLDFVETLAERALFIENGKIADRVDDIAGLRANTALVHKYLSI